MIYKINSMYVALRGFSINYTENNTVSKFIVSKGSLWEIKVVDYNERKVGLQQLSESPDKKRVLVYFDLLEDSFVKVGESNEQL